jgi:hypothetical protein
VLAQEATLPCPRIILGWVSACIDFDPIAWTERAILFMLERRCQFTYEDLMIS